jgi:hypothetical protein
MRGRLRYWNGSLWTDHVDKRGIPSVEPVRRPYVAADFSAGRNKRRTRRGIAVTALALVAAAMWFAWLGWDHTYYVVNGVAQGPYRAGQVIGCGLAVALAAVLAHLWVREKVALLFLAAAADVGFAIPWAVDAAGADESGLWVVGLLLLLVGGGVGLLCVLTLTEAILTIRRRWQLRGPRGS